MKTASYRDIVPLYNASLQGDPEAKAFFKSQWDDDEPCFYCDKPVGEERRTLLFADPKLVKNINLIPCCAECYALPIEKRNALALKIFKSMWPRYPWQIGKFPG